MQSRRRRGLCHREAGDEEEQEDRQEADAGDAEGDEDEEEQSLGEHRRRGPAGGGGGGRWGGIIERRHGGMVARGGSGLSRTGGSCQLPRCTARGSEALAASCQWHRAGGFVMPDVVSYRGVPPDLAWRGLWTWLAMGRYNREGIPLR